MSGIKQYIIFLKTIIQCILKKMFCRKQCNIVLRQFKATLNKIYHSDKTMEISVITFL